SHAHSKDQILTNESAKKRLERELSTNNFDLVQLQVLDKHLNTILKSVAVNPSTNLIYFFSHLYNNAFQKRYISKRNSRYTYTSPSIASDCLGLKEPTSSQRNKYLVEIVGTFVLVYAICSAATVYHNTGQLGI